MDTLHAIELRFIRIAAGGRAETNPALDDVLKIRPSADPARLNSFRIVFLERSGESPNVDIMTLSQEQLLAYLYRLFWSMTIDDDPFQSVQFFVPGIPTFLVLASTVTKNLPQLLDIIMSVCWNWPTLGNYERDCCDSPTRPRPSALDSLLRGVGSPQESADSSSDGENSTS